MMNKNAVFTFLFGLLITICSGPASFAAPDQVHLSSYFLVLGPDVKVSAYPKTEPLQVTRFGTILHLSQQVKRGTITKLEIDPQKPSRLRISYEYMLGDAETRVKFPNPEVARYVLDLLTSHPVQVLATQEAMSLSLGLAQKELDYTDLWIFNRKLSRFMRLDDFVFYSEDQEPWIQGVVKACSRLLGK